jgi:hypothetical protein
MRPSNAERRFETFIDLRHGDDVASIHLRCSW